MTILVIISAALALLSGYTTGYVLCKVIDLKSAPLWGFYLGVFVVGLVGLLTLSGGL